MWRYESAILMSSHVVPISTLYDITPDIPVNDPPVIFFYGLLSALTTDHIRVCVCVCVCVCTHAHAHTWVFVCV